MTDMEIMQILTSGMDIFDQGKAFRKAFDALKPSALKVQPIKERKKRVKTALIQTEAGLVQNGLDHAEAN